MGLDPSYSFNVLNVNNKGGFELRNSWGTVEERSKITFSKEGQFEWSSAQARENLSHILISHVRQNYFTSVLQSKHKFGFYSSYNFKVKKETHGYVTVSQWDERLFPETVGYEYSPFRVLIQKLNSDGTGTFVNAGTHRHYSRLYPQREKPGR